jgi:hypothetical protein
MEEEVKVELPPPVLVATIDKPHERRQIFAYTAEQMRQAILAEREHVTRLAAALADLLERVRLNGGLGEYKGGPAFAVKNAEDALAAIRKG